MFKTLKDIKIKNTWKKDLIFIKVLIIRGIGYRAFSLIYQSFLEMKKKLQINKEDNININKLYNHSFKKYIIVRAGHTLDLIQPLPHNVFAFTFKRERKLIIFGFDKQEINKLSKLLYQYRKPSAYTGRGVRQKHIKILRKEGKKDKQKGKGF